MKAGLGNVCTVLVGSTWGARDGGQGSQRGPSSLRDVSTLVDVEGRGGHVAPFSFLFSEFSSALEYLKLLHSFVDSVGFVASPFSSSSVLRSALGECLHGPRA